MELIGELFAGADSTYVNVYIAIFRWAAPILAVLLLFRFCPIKANAENASVVFTLLDSLEKCRDRRHSLKQIGAYKF